MNHRVSAFVGGEACPAPTAEAARGGEGVKRVDASAEDNEIAPHLPTALGLEPYDRMCYGTDLTALMKACSFRSRPS